MENNSSEEQKATPFGKGLTPEETQVLQECNTESFYYRCVPLSCSLIALTQYLVKTGKLNPNPKLGAVPKCVSAALVGFVIGKVSYQNKCREKILRLENSSLADAIRKQKDKRLLPADFVPADFANKTPANIDADYSEGNDLADRNEKIDNLYDFDNERKDKNSFDNTNYSQNVNYGFMTSAPAENDQTITSYDDLREKNRLDHIKKSQHRIKSVEVPPKSKPVKTNAYGDVIDEE